ncbi:MAG: endonuclease III [Armatimonadetes bacterium]|nr:endonuclease III [Armatimonadota bacterium]
MKTETLEKRSDRALRIIEMLRIEYPDAKCSLDFTTPHELLVAAILAAQCTDVRVNMVTPELFRKYPNVEAFANADYAELEEMVKPAGFFRNKSRAIIESARQIVSDFGGKVPETMDELLSLNGVGRKTANLILGVAYKKPAIIVDTHVKRVSKRLGLTENEDPTKIEFDLDKILPEQEWTHFNHLIIYHGRAICKAPTPLCGSCVALSLCPFGQERLGKHRK